MSSEQMIFCHKSYFAVVGSSLCGLIELIERSVALTFLLLALLISSLMVVLNPVEAAAISYELSIAVNGYGVTSPACGSYYYEEGSEVSVYATDSYSEWGWLFDYWVLDGVKIEKKNNNPLRIVMDRNHELMAEFAQAPIPFPTPEATPSQSPVLEPTATPAATPSPSASTQPPEIPELPSVFILLIFTIVTLLVAVLQFRNRKPYTLFPLCPY